ncbi:MAG: hypothetical protein NTV22_15910 [bacterium]|nr:hypothetical protein [bacterium]
MKTVPMTTAARDALSQRRESLLKELATLAPFCRGSLHPFRVRRGAKEWQYYTWEVGSGTRRANRTLRVQQVEHIQAGIARRKAYEQWRANFEQTMEECFLADARGIEKKTGAAATSLPAPRRTAALRRWRQDDMPMKHCSTKPQPRRRSKTAVVRSAARR